MLQECVQPGAALPCIHPSPAGSKPEPPAAEGTGLYQEWQNSPQNTPAFELGTHCYSSLFWQQLRLGSGLVLGAAGTCLELRSSEFHQLKAPLAGSCAPVTLGPPTRS